MLVGIDLGTTNSLISIYKDGEVVLVPNSYQKNTTPSYISLDKDNKLIVGEAAKERQFIDSKNTINSFKRRIGTTKNYKLGDHELSASALSSFILKSLIEDAERFSGEKVSEAIITVPAYFNDIQRKDTLVAAEMADLKVKRLINEPTAAALSYGVGVEEDQTILVFDLGGGTFDISIVEVFDGVFEVHSSTGDNNLGGDDFTEVIIAYFFQEIKQQANHPNFGMTHEIYSSLFKMAEEAKVSMSNTHNYSGQISVLNRNISLNIDSAKFEELSKDLIERLTIPMKQAIRDSELNSDEIDHIVLVGGATRMPFIRKIIVDIFKKLPLSKLNPDEAICIGARTLGAILEKEDGFSENIITDVTSFSLGTDVYMQYASNAPGDVIFQPIINRNTVIPCSAAEKYFAISPAQEAIQINVYQGESRKPEDNVLLGEIRCPLEKDFDMSKGIEVRFTHDASGLLEVIITDYDSGKQYSEIFSQHDTNISDEEKKKIFESLSELKLLPIEKQENIFILDKLNRVYEQGPINEREKINNLIMGFNHALESGRQENIEELKEYILKYFTELGF